MGGGSTTVDGPKKDGISPEVVTGVLRSPGWAPPQPSESTFPAASASEMETSPAAPRCTEDGEPADGSRATTAATDGSPTDADTEEDEGDEEGSPVVAAATDTETVAVVVPATPEDERPTTDKGLLLSDEVSLYEAKLSTLTKWCS
jgi:hypothetical protein